MRRLRRLPGRTTVPNPRARCIAPHPRGTMHRADRVPRSADSSSRSSVIIRCGWAAGVMARATKRSPRRAAPGGAGKRLPGGRNLRLPAAYAEVTGRADTSEEELMTPPREDDVPTIGVRAFAAELKAQREARG